MRFKVGDIVRVSKNYKDYWENMPERIDGEVIGINVGADCHFRVDWGTGHFGRFNQETKMIKLVTRAD